MNGTEYIKYKKFKLEKNKKIKNALTTSIPFFLIALILIFVIIYIHEVPESKSYGFTIYKGFIIPNLIIYIVIISICLAWIFHGFGFIIIKG